MKIHIRQLFRRILINKFTVFYYPDQVINITLKKDINVKQETTSNGT